MVCLIVELTPSLSQLGVAAAAAQMAQPALAATPSNATGGVVSGSGGPPGGHSGSAYTTFTPYPAPAYPGTSNDHRHTTSR
jgi:hypothetical protein